jgi:hypothetical protein
MCWHSVSDNMDVSGLFLFVSIYLVQIFYNCVLFHITPADHFGLDNVNKEHKTRKR